MELLINLINYIPDIFQYIFAFAILITVVVFVHEMGHYLVGKWCGIGVETFSIGMGKQIWGRYDKSGTLWRVALFPQSVDMLSLREMKTYLEKEIKHINKTK